MPERTEPKVRDMLWNGRTRFFNKWTVRKARAEEGNPQKTRQEDERPVATCAFCLNADLNENLEIYRTGRETEH